MKNQGPQAECLGLAEVFHPLWSLLSCRWCNLVRSVTSAVPASNLSLSVNTKCQDSSPCYHQKLHFKYRVNSYLKILQVSCSVSHEFFLQQTSQIWQFTTLQWIMSPLLWTRSLSTRGYASSPMFVFFFFFFLWQF